MENLNAENIINEIQSLIKALKDCGGWVKRGNGEGWFNHEILADALALITSQEQRIKELTEENERLRADKDYWKNRTKESESEYDQAVKRGYNLGAIDYVGSFAERLKAETIIIQDHTGKLGSVILVSTIDQIAKEMLEGE